MYEGKSLFSKGSSSDSVAQKPVSEYDLQDESANGVSAK